MIRPALFTSLTFTAFVSATGASSVVGPLTLCPGTTNLFSVATDLTNGVYAWTVGTNNSAGAVIFGDTNTASVSVFATNSGGFSLDCFVDPGGSNELATTNILVPELISGSALTNQVACSGDNVTFATTITGGPGYSVLWRKDGDVLIGATTEILTLTNVGAAEAGTYCVEVTGPCNSFTNCATLDLVPLAGLSCPTNLLLQCPLDVPAPDTNSVTATNAVSLLFLGDLATTNGCEITITRTYGAVNSCGHTLTCAQVILVQDIAPPVLACATNRTVEWGEVWDFDMPTASDLCDGSNVVVSVFNTVTNPLCGGSFWTERTWLAVDACGNSNTCSQIITNLDTTAPVLIGGTNRTVECGEAWEFDPPTVLDACEGTNVTVVILDTLTNATCGNTFIATRTWQATDSCTNAATCSQTITVVDTTPPVWLGATNRTVECGTAWDFDVPTANDVCSGTNVLIAVLGTVTNALCGNTFEAIRTWQAVDICTNIATFSQTITVIDTAVPLLTCATNRTVECGDLWDFDLPLADDACSPSNIVVTVLNTVTNPLCGGSFWAERTWLAVDACGNSNTCSQIITNLDTTPPQFTCATNRTVECGAVWDFDPPVVDDVCSPSNIVVSVLGTVTNPICGGSFWAERTWLAVDECGNSNTCSQIITNLDTTPPEITCPSNIVVECAGYPGTQVWFTPTAFDICDTNVALVSVPDSGTYFTLGTNVVICTAADACGNSNQCSFTVTVIDTTPPEITCPPNMIIAEAPRDSGGAAVTFTPTAGDICDSVPAIVSVPASGTNFPVGYTTVQNTATDGSGNTNACSFTIRVIPYRLSVLNTNDSGPGSLRQAMLDANDSPDANLILFSIPGAGVQTIQPLTALPEVTSPVTIDGWSQAGFTNLPLIQINGALAGAGVDGLYLTSSSNVIRGLALNGFATAIRMATNGSNGIQGNFIGTDTFGTSAAPNTDGIVVASGNNFIASNLISGNASNGVVLVTVSASNNVVQANYIGTVLNGSSPLANGRNGVVLDDQVSNNLVGGHTGGGNLIAFNGANGVMLTSYAGNGNVIARNFIESNGTLGIDLGDDGPTANDLYDSDSGPNRLQNFPVLTDATSESGFTTVSGTLHSAPSRTYHLEFFLNDTTNASGFGEGKTFIGSLDQFVQSDGNGDFALAFPVPATFVQFVTATATDSDGNSSEFSLPIQVRTPPVIESSPTNAALIEGSNYTVCVTVSGTPPIYYQWRLNGQNIPGATNQCYTITSAQAGDSGNYTVVVQNELGLLGSSGASLLLPQPVLAGGDYFVDRVPLTGSTGIVAGSTILATREPGEPLHANKPGGKSVWYKWVAPHHGITTVGTYGSDFDTLLAVYNVAPNKLPYVTNLVVVASDEDGGGYFTSGMRFNVAKEREYMVAIDGFSGDSGDFALNWSFEKTGYMLPKIWTNPVSQTVTPGSNVTFRVFAVPVCGSAKENCQNPSHYENGIVPDILYQWLFNGVPIAGETNQQLFVPDADIGNVGNYSVLVSQVNSVVDRTIESQVASLQVNDTDGGIQNVQVYDKYQDAFNSTPLQLGVGVEPDGISAQAAIVVAGYSGSQVFNTTAGTSQGEVFCGVIGGSSEWLNFVSGVSGVLTLNTDGSSFDTLLAVLQSNLPPVLLGCDNNSGLGGTNSALVVPVVAGKNYLIGVDGVNGKFGRVVLNYSLNPSAPAGAPQISNVGTTNGVVKFRINSITNKFVVQVSSNLASWIPLSTNPAPVYLYDFVDWRSTNFARRYYRVQVVP